MQVTPVVIAKLRQLEAEPKFLPDDKLLYPGARSNPPREVGELALNAFLADIREGISQQPRRSYLLARMRPLLVAAQDWDSEDQERLGAYLGDVIDITGAGSSNELINVWRYGFPYGWLA